MSFKIITTTPFEREFKQLSKKYPSLKKDIVLLSTTLIANPQSGTSLGNNCYKIRMPINSKGKGKSGGARIITYVKIVKETVFLLAIYDKSEMENIPDKELQSRLANIKTNV